MQQVLYDSTTRYNEFLTLSTITYRMTSRTVIGNWKMHGLRAEGILLASAIRDSMAGTPGLTVDVVLCPPFHLLSTIGETLAGSPIALGAQDCHIQPKGAYTGDVSAPMLADIGCRYTLVGHSERRERHGESDATVKQKAEAALQAGLIPVICLGESEDDRKEDRVFDVLGAQLSGSLPAAEYLTGPARYIIAYEPLWAIGSGVTPTLEDIVDAHRFLHGELSRHGVKAGVLYGGSVKAANAVEILSCPGVDGVLVGGASLKAEEFLPIIHAAVQTVEGVTY